MEQPVDLSKLMNQLAGAKKIMAKDKLVSSNPTVSNSPTYTDQEKPMPMMEYTTKAPQNVVPTNNGYNPNVANTSKLPKEIMESLLNNPIDVQVNPTAGIDDLAKQLDEMAGIAPQQRQVVSEQIQPSGGLNENQIRSIVQEELMKFFGETMVKNVTEQVLSKFRKKKS